MIVQVNRGLLTGLIFGVPMFFISVTFIFLLLLFKAHLTLTFTLSAIFVSEVIVITLILVVLGKARSRVEAVESDNQKLLAFGDRYLHLYRSSPVPYIHVNSAGVITLSNVAARRLFEVKEHKLVGQLLADFLDHPDETSKSIILNKLSSRTTFSDEEMILRTGNGEERWVNLSSHTYSKNEDMFVTLTDVTNKKMIDKAKTEFVSLAAHQLRTPLTASNMALSMLEENMVEKTPQQQQYLTVMRNSIMRLLVLVDDFLSVSKFETGSFATAVSDVALHTEIPEIISQYESRIREKRIHVSFTIEPKTIFTKLDSRLLRMAIGNLISNATKYNKEAGEIKVSCRVVGDTLEITVADTGLGVPLADQAKLFNKFHRAQNVQTAQIKGNGLGLYIVKEALALMGGDITFESEENKGTTFTVTLPIY